MSFEALASQGRIAAQRQRPTDRSRKAKEPPPEEKKLTEAEKVTVRRLFAKGAKPLGLRQKFKVSAAEIEKALA